MDFKKILSRLEEVCLTLWSVNSMFGINEVFVGHVCRLYRSKLSIKNVDNNKKMKYFANRREVKTILETFIFIIYRCHILHMWRIYYISYWKKPKNSIKKIKKLK